MCEVAAKQSSNVHNRARLWHKHGAMTRPPPRQRPPLTAEKLERLALHYVGRYATTRAKLQAYLLRKIKERGWCDDGAPGIEQLVGKLVGLGYVDDAAFAASRTGALLRRGYGERRIGGALRAAGIGGSEMDAARAQAADGSWEAALRYAARKRIGPYAAHVPERELRQKAFAAMMRAGHSTDHARRILSLNPGEIPAEPDD